MAATTDATRGAVLRRTWGNRRLRRVLAAYLLFNVAEWATYLALLIHAYELDGVRSASAIALAQLVPAAVLASPAAAVLGRLDTGAALAWGYAAQAVAGAGVAGALLLDLPFPVVAVAASFLAVTVTFTRPVHHALLPEISDTTAELTAGNAASGTVEATATLAGPLACGLVVAVWSPGGVVVLMAAGAAASTVLVPARRRQAPAWEDGEGLPPLPPRPRVLRQLADVAADPSARLLSALVAAEYALVGMLDMLLVVLAFDRLHLDASGPGWLNAALGVGGLAGAAATLLIVGARRLAPALAVGALAAGLPLALTGVVPGAWAALLLLAVAGAGKTFFDVTSRTLVQRLLPDRLLGAVFGVQESLMMTGLAVGSLLAPVLVVTAGGTVAFAIAGLMLPLAVLAALPGLSRRDAQAEVPQAVLTRLLDVPLLAVLPPRLVERMARMAQPQSAAPGAVVVAEGEPGSLFYVVDAGTLTVGHGPDELRRLGPGDWFGELALLRDGRRTATVTALSDVRLLTLDRDTFLTTLAGQPRSYGVAREHADEHYR